MSLFSPPRCEWNGATDEKSLSELLRRNEQIKAASGLACNAGLAVAAAGRADGSLRAPMVMRSSGF
jgi:hypothetical protein